MADVGLAKPAGVDRHAFQLSTRRASVADAAEPIDWNLVVRLGAIGALIGLLLGADLVPIRFTTALWLAVAFIWAITIARKAPRAPWRTGVLVGLLGGFLAGDVLGLLFYDTYEPKLAQVLGFDQGGAPAGNATGNTTDNTTGNATDGAGPIPRTAIILNGVLTGGLYGLLAGLSAYLIGRFARPRAVELEDMDAEE